MSKRPPFFTEPPATKKCLAERSAILDEVNKAAEHTTGDAQLEAITAVLKARGVAVPSFELPLKDAYEAGQERVDRVARDLLAKCATLKRDTPPKQR